MKKRKLPMPLAAVREAAEEAGLNSSTVVRRIYHGKTLEEALVPGRERRPARLPKAPRKLSRSVKDVKKAAAEAGVSHHTVIKRMYSGKKLKDSLSPVEHHQPHGPKPDGRKLPHSIKEIEQAAKAAKTSFPAVLRRMYLGWTLEEALKKPVRKRSDVLVRRALAAGIPTQIVYQRMRRGGMSLEAALSTPYEPLPTYISPDEPLQVAIVAAIREHLEYEGEAPSLTVIAKVVGYHPTTIWNRLQILLRDGLVVRRRDKYYPPS